METLLISEKQNLVEKRAYSNKKRRAPNLTRKEFYYPTIFIYSSTFNIGLGDVSLGDVSLGDVDFYF